MKKYESPVIYVTEFKQEDIITLSAVTTTTQIIGENDVISIDL